MTLKKNSFVQFQLVFMLFAVLNVNSQVKSPIKDYKYYIENE